MTRLLRAASSPRLAAGIALTVAIFAGGPGPANARDTAPPGAARSCATLDRYCVALTLSRLYSRGAEIATAPCAGASDTCETRRAGDLAEAARNYREYRDRVRSLQRDPGFAAAFGENGERATEAKVATFVDAALAGMTERCGLGSRDCIGARTYLLADLDQAVRAYPVCAANPDTSSICWQGKQAGMARVDAVSTTFAAQTLRTFGWLDAKDWGAATEDAFFLLVQHADAAPAVQRLGLAALRRSVTAGKGSSRHLAYLEDRVRVHARQAQLYGTQGRCEGSGSATTWTPDPIEDPANLDARRRSAGLSDFAQYKAEAVSGCKNL